MHDQCLSTSSIENRGSDVQKERTRTSENTTQTLSECGGETNEEGEDRDDKESHKKASEAWGEITITP